MRLSHPELPLLPLLLPVFCIGLSPLLVVCLIGYLGIAIAGVLVGFATIMMQLDEQGGQAFHRITRPGMPHSERAGQRAELQSLMQTLWVARLVSAAMVIVGLGGFFLSG